MLKKTILIFTIFALLAAGYFCLPKYTAEVCRRKQFVVDRDFVSMRKSLSQGRFEEEILRANNATMIQKSWIDKGFHIERPLRKDRYWEFNGVLQAKVSVNDPRTGQMTVDLQHKVLVTPEQIDLEATLMRPLSVGVTDLRQKIHMEPFPEFPVSSLLRTFISVATSKIPNFYWLRHRLRPVFFIKFLGDGCDFWNKANVSVAFVFEDVHLAQNFRASFIHKNLWIGQSRRNEFVISSGIHSVAKALDKPIHLSGFWPQQGFRSTDHTGLPISVKNLGSSPKKITSGRLMIFVSGGNSNSR